MAPNPAALAARSVYDMLRVNPDLKKLGLSVDDLHPAGQRRVLAAIQHCVEVGFWRKHPDRGPFA